MARLAVRRLYERLEAGAAVSPADAVALLRLAREIERDGASSARPGPRWQASMAEVLCLARRHLGEGWEPFAADLRASAALRALWGDPSRPGRK